MVIASDGKLMDEQKENGKLYSLREITAFVLCIWTNLWFLKALIFFLPMSGCETLICLAVIMFLKGVHLWKQTYPWGTKRMSTTS